MSECTKRKTDNQDCPSKDKVDLRLHLPDPLDYLRKMFGVSDARS